MTIKQQEKQDLPPLPTPPEQLLAVLKELGIDYSYYEHDPVFSVEESAPLKAGIPGTHCRCLFLRDKKQAMFLVVAANDTPVDLKGLQNQLGCGRLSFGSEERLWRVLGVRPGSVCPFAVINDTGREVTVILDQCMMAAEIVNYHPMQNDMTIGLSPQDLQVFLEYCGHEPRIYDFKKEEA